MRGRPLLLAALLVAGVGLAQDPVGTGPCRVDGTDCISVPGGVAGGDLVGTYPNPTVQAIQGVAVSGSAAAGKALVASNGSNASWQTIGAGTCASGDRFALFTDVNVVGCNADVTWNAASKYGVFNGYGLGDDVYQPVVKIRADAHRQAQGALVVTGVWTGIYAESTNVDGGGSGSAAVSGYGMTGASFTGAGAGDSDEGYGIVASGSSGAGGALFRVFGTPSKPSVLLDARASEGVRTDGNAMEVRTDGGNVFVLSNAGDVTAKSVSADYVKPSGTQAIRFVDSSSLTTATQYEFKGAVLRSKRLTTFEETVADAKASPPGSWTLVNSSNLASADGNTTTAHALRFVGSSQATYDAGAPSWTAPFYYRTYSGNGSAPQVFIYRMAVTGCTSDASNWAGIGFQQADDNTKRGRLLIRCSGNFYWDYQTTNGSGGTNDSTSRGNGIWLAVVRDGTVMNTFYSTANQSTPPTTWSTGGSFTVLADAHRAIKIGPVVGRGTGTAPTVDWLYYNDQGAVLSDAPLTALYGAQPAVNAGLLSGTEQSLVYDFDMGSSSATIADADVQAALGRVSNVIDSFARVDSGSWTFSAVRGSQAHPASSTYQAAGSVTVGGSGRHFALYGKCASSTRTETCSIDLSLLSIPFTP